MGRKLRFGVELLIFFIFYILIAYFLWKTVRESVATSSDISGVALVLSFTALYITIIKETHKMFSVWTGFDKPLLMPRIYRDIEKGTKCWFGLQNEGEAKAKSASIRYFFDGNISELTKVIPKKGGYIFYPGITRGPWSFPEGYLLPNHFNGKNILFSVETKIAMFPDQKYCTCRTFESNSNEWIPLLDKDCSTDPYLWKFKRCKKCPFGEK